MLWEKELHTKDSVFVDLLDNVQYQLHNYPVHRRKSNATSLRLRMDGNKKYNAGDLEGALIKYNESACMAENDTEELGLSYANRSLCFLKLQLYERCLVDIELARKCGYPVHSSSKLDNRRNECLKLMKSKSTEKADVKLDDMVGALEMHNDDIYGRFLIATRDIEIGETLLIEESYVRTLNSDESNGCTNCGSKRMNFIPCKSCADAMYCCETCAKNNFHQNECDMIIGTMEDNEYLAFIIRSVVVGISAFSNTSEMMKFVENSRSSEVSWSESLQSPKSKYNFFLKLAMSSSLFDSSTLNLRKKAYFIYHAITSSSNLSNKFTTINEKRFLTHLIIHHGIILKTNAFQVEDDEETVHELCLRTSYFNHSCLPNTARLSKGNLSICKAILRIKKGEQLFVTYIHEEVFNMTEKQRNNQLQDMYGFRCKCKLCREGTLLSVGLEKDPCFKYIAASADSSNPFADIDNAKKRCIEFLNNHSDSVGSQEVSYIAEILTAMFSKELNM